MTIASALRDILLLHDDTRRRVIARLEALGYGEEEIDDATFAAAESYLEDTGEDLWTDLEVTLCA